MTDTSFVKVSNKVRSSTVRVGVPIARARLVILWEGVWRAAWPVLCVVGLFLALALMDVFPQLPGWLHGLALAGLAAGLLVTMWRSARLISLPDRRSAERRLETASGLSHRPLQVLSDRIASGAGDAASRELWDLHRKRMAEAAGNLRTGMPQPAVARLDRIAVRAAVVVLLVVGVAAGWANPRERLGRAVSPQIGFLAAAAPPSLELWITPPEYTRLAPLFPKPNAPKDDVLTVPEGSALVARVAGGRGTPVLTIGEDEPVQFDAVDSVNSQVETTISRGGRLSIEQDGAILGDWRVEIVPDTPPAIAFARPPFATKGATLGIAYTAADDYGLGEARIEIRRTYEDGAVIGKEVKELELPLPGLNAKSADETTFHDLAPHAWAGLPVTIKLRATDVAGQVTYSDDAKVILPEREFRHPVARAIIEQRKRLATEPHRRRSIFLGLSEIAARPKAFDEDNVVFLGLIAARSRLRHEKEKTAIKPVRDLLWALALRVEDGRLSIAERELRRLEKELMKALAENAPDEELERLMRELEQAMNRYLQALMEQLRNQPQSQQAMPFDPRMRIIQGQDIQRMMDQIRRLMRSGARDAARQLLAQLRNLMESLRSARMFRGTPRNSQAGKMMRQLQEMIRRQSDLMNRTFRQSRGMPGPQPGQSQQGASAQRRLQQMLQQFRQMMGRMGAGRQGQQGPGQALREAERQMGRAAQSLDQNAPGRAVGPMGEALNNLQKAGRGMMRQMMRRFSRQSGMGLQGQFNPLRMRRDPLGRFPPGMEGMDTRDVVVPDEAAVERAQRILNELRRRSGQRHRPGFELDYIDRLLRRF